MAKPRIRNRNHALYGGVALIIGGSVLLWDAHEARGVDRPFWTKFLPGG